MIDASRYLGQCCGRGLDHCWAAAKETASNNTMPAKSSNVTMPAQSSELRKRSAAARQKAQRIRAESERVRAELNTLTSTIEQAFTAAHGRPMTEKERRKFFDVGGK